MASRLFAAAAAAASSSPPLARLVTRRGLADKPWTPHPDNWKVNLWEDPLSPMRWKSSHFVTATIAVWGVWVFGLCKFLDAWGDEQEDRPRSTAKAKAW